MTLEKLDSYFRSILPISDLEKTDSSLNGIQVGDTAAEIKKIAFTVDACMRTFTTAGTLEADCIFVHHGLFWGKPLAITDTHYDRVRFLIKNELSLYAVHLPLDMHPEYGNNAGLAARLNLEEREEFGLYKNFYIGWKGRLPKPMLMNDVLNTLGLVQNDCLALLPFGPEEINTVAVISGGAALELEQAIQAKADLYITGEASHSMYHQALEAGINVIAGGHYNTETWGVKLLKEKCAADTEIETVFIDSPTGL